jgi:hypothetical protein
MRRSLFGLMCWADALFSLRHYIWQILGLPRNPRWCSRMLAWQSWRRLMHNYLQSSMLLDLDWRRLSSDLRLWRPSQRFWWFEHFAWRRCERKSRSGEGGMWEGATISKLTAQEIGRAPGCYGGDSGCAGWGNSWIFPPPTLLSLIFWSCFRRRSRLYPSPFRMQWEYHLFHSDWCHQDACGGGVWAFVGA